MKKHHFIFVLALLLYACPVLAQVQEAPETQKTDEKQSRTYIGVVSDKEKVEIVARIPSTIQKVAFQEGSLVKQGDLLYELDDTIQKLKIQKAAAVVKGIETKLKYAASGRGNDAGAYTELPGPEILRAKLDAVKADFELAANELSFTKIHAPISGRIGCNHYAVGTYVTPEKGALATIIPQDSAVVRFSLSERELLKHLDANGDFDKKSFGRVVLESLSGEAIPRKCEIESVGNVIDRETGCVTINLRCENPDRKLFPGSTVRVKVDSK